MNLSLRKEIRVMGEHFGKKLVLSSQGASALSNLLSSNEDYLYALTALRMVFSLPLSTEKSLISFSKSSIGCAHLVDLWVSLEVDFEEQSSNGLERLYAMRKEGGTCFLYELDLFADLVMYLSRYRSAHLKFVIVEYARL